MLTGLFPIPQYGPDGGYTIEPSLLLSFARIESRFQADATSPVGARGLMQLMPVTAAHLGASPLDLDNPSASLAYGQRYLNELIARLNGNLLELAAAYNAGPGSLSRWLAQRDGKGDDPLLFIESVPAAETRSYIKRVMTYHWMYSRRLGHQADRCLDDMAIGAWPHYHPGAMQSPGPVTPQTPTTSRISDARTDHDSLTP